MVTIDKQTRKQLARTLISIKENIKKFRSIGIANHEIAVVVIFDGIKNINDNKITDLSLI